MKTGNTNITLTDTRTGHEQEKILYKELSYKIKQAAIEVRKYLGAGFLEKVYENAMAIKLRKMNIKCRQQVPIKVYFENEIVGEYIADLLIEDKIIIEMKVTEELHPIHFAQLKNYLKATRLRLGLLINFGKSFFEFERIVL